MTFALASRDGAVIDMVDEAVRHKQVSLVFQSIVPAGDQTLPAFYEGFVRVLDATGRIIPAKDFIHEIEEMETGRIVDCLALEQGLQCLRRFPDLRLAINMSARSIGYPRWIRSLKRGLAKDETVAERLILEITESSAMMIPELVVNFMEEMRRAGVSFALDDFGSGFTSFRHLRDFFFDIVKIDGQFIRGISSSTVIRCWCALSWRFQKSLIWSQWPKVSRTHLMQSSCSISVLIAFRDTILVRRQQSILGEKRLRNALLLADL